MSVRDTIRASKPTVVEFPLGNGTSIWIRAMSGPARAAYRAKSAGREEGNPVPPEYVAALAICEQDGTPAYNAEEASEIAELLEHFDAHVLDAIALKFFSISGLTEKAEKESEKN